MSWEAVTNDDDSQAVASAYVSQRARSIVQCRLEMYGFAVGPPNKVTLAGTSVHHSSTVSSSQQHSGTHEHAAVSQVASAISDAARSALEMLVVEPQQLAPPSLRHEYDDGQAPALRMEISMLSYRPGESEVQVAMPEPRIFREALAAGENLKSIASKLSALIDAEVRDAVRSYAFSNPTQQEGDGDRLL